VRAGETILLRRRRLSALPERRILLDLENIKLPLGVSQITVEIVA
jgi:hypothetical protein